MGKRQEEQVRRHGLLESAITDIVNRIDQAASEYGPRFKKNAAHEAIIDEVIIRLAKPGRKPSVKPAGRPRKAKVEVEA
jgi:hypothetical protein